MDVPVGHKLSKLIVYALRPTFASIAHISSMSAVLIEMCFIHMCGKWKYIPIFVLLFVVGLHMITWQATFWKRKSKQSPIHTHSHIAAGRLTICHVVLSTRCIDNNSKKVPLFIYRPGCAVHHDCKEVIIMDDMQHDD